MGDGRKGERTSIKEGGLWCKSIVYLKTDWKIQSEDFQYFTRLLVEGVQQGTLYG